MEDFCKSHSFIFCIISFLLGHRREFQEFSFYKFFCWSEISFWAFNSSVLFTLFVCLAGISLFLNSWNLWAPYSLCLSSDGFGWQSLWILAYLQNHYLLPGELKAVLSRYRIREWHFFSLSSLDIWSHSFFTSNFENELSASGYFFPISTLFFLSREKHKISLYPCYLYGRNPV